jgi:biopolymer transport protein ExbB/TolQ
MHAFQQGGIMMYPLLLIGAGVLFLAGQTAWRLRHGTATAAEVERPLQGVLFWGIFSVVLGLLGTTIGMIQAAQAIQLAGRVEPLLVWGGIGVMLVTLIFGLLIFLLSALLWFVLRQWSWRRFSA